MTWATVLAAALALVACQRASDAPQAEEVEPSLTDRVKVIDASVLVIDDRRIRLANADLPRLAPDARCWAEAIAAKEATYFVQEAVEQGGRIEVEGERGRDRMGRTLAQVRIDGMDLGDRLYEAGLAARPGERRFDWCGPLSRSLQGAPPLEPLFATGRRPQ